MIVMKRAVWSLVFLVALTLGAVQVKRVSAASSDDFSGNYARRDPEDYNFLPLVLDPDSSTGDTGQPRDTISYNLAYDQGYEVQCAKPEWNITPQVYGDLEEYFRLLPNQGFNLGADASYNVDFSTGRIPLFRGDEDLADTQKNTSFEGYFGANYLKKTPPTVNSSGVANLLMNQNGQCVAKFANLYSLFNDGGVCSKLSDPSQCVLDRQIADTAFTTEELYGELSDLFELKNEEERNLGCADIISGWSEDLTNFGLTEQRFNSEVQPAVDALQKMPLNLDILYRLAFLVIAPEQNVNEGDDVFSFLQNQSPQPNQANHATVDQYRHAPIIIGFKIPILATNSLFSMPYLRDSSILTAYSMRNLPQLQREQEEVKEARDEFVKKIDANKHTQPVVKCEGMPQCTGSGQDQALFQAIMDVINGSEISCKGFDGPYEKAGDLGSPAAVDEEKAFQDRYVSTVLPTANSAGFQWELEVNDANVGSELNQEKVPVNAYFVTPYGTDLAYITDTLRSFFPVDDPTTEELEGYEKMVENNCIEDFHGECGLIPEYFTLGGITADLDSTSNSHSPTSTDCARHPVGSEEREQCESLTVGATLTEQPREPIRILGASIGWMIQKIQENLRGIQSKAYAYIKECKRAEDLFLGRCLGYQGQTGGTDSEVANSCNDYAAIQVELPSDFTELANWVRGAAHGNASDAQLLWGLTQVEGHPMNDAIRDRKKSVACADLIINSCGASQIVGIIVPQCADVQACPGAAFSQEDGAAGQAYRDSITTEVACSVKGALEFILRTRKSQIGELKSLYQARWGREPDDKQLYYMMAGKNYGLPNEVLVQPACQGAEEVSGCGGANYCQCVMDTFTIP